MSSLRQPSEQVPEITSLTCPSARALLQTFIAAVRHANELSEQQILAAITGDGDLHRFEMLISQAGELRQEAKYAFMRHTEEHRCVPSDIDFAL
jgi:hypothetical protein